MMKNLFYLFFFLLFFSCSNHSLRYFQPNLKETGRAVTLAVDPNDDKIIYVASETGGIYKTTNGGAFWKHLKNFPTYLVMDIKIAPTNSDIILATARADFRTVNGGGIWRSTDGGATWRKPPTSIPTPNERCTSRPSGLAISFIPNSEKVYAGTSCGLAISEDNGATWRQLIVDENIDIAWHKKQDGLKSLLAIDENVALAINNWRKLYRTDNGGRTWRQISGIEFQNQGIHCIAVSPLNKDHIYITTGANFVYQSTNGGRNWRRIYEGSRKATREPFIQCALTYSGFRSPASQPRNYTVYFGDGYSLKKRKFSQDHYLPVSNWEQIKIDHADPCHLAFANDNRTPLLLATDGGLHSPSPYTGDDWTMNGKVSYGYDALQITEVKGQKIATDEKSDLYFGTQDNKLWASKNAGESWEKEICCEGLYLEMERDVATREDAQITLKSCVSCVNRFSGKEFSNLENWKNPPKFTDPEDEDYKAAVGSPAIIKKDFFVQLVEKEKGVLSLFLTDNAGENWDEKIKLDYWVKSHPLVVGDKNNPVIYLAVKLSGERSDENNIGLLKVENILSGEEVTTTLFDNINAIGTFRTMFGWYEVFAVNPENPDHIIVTDVINKRVLVTKDGGRTDWIEDSNLIKEVTNDGEFLFSNNFFTQITKIEFDPCNNNHILVGTTQAGIIQSKDGGASWERLEKTNYPLISSFFFGYDEKTVVFSTYGRGLWKLITDRGCGSATINLPADNITNQPSDPVVTPNPNTPYLRITEPYVKLSGSEIGMDGAFTSGEHLFINGINFSNYENNIMLQIDDFIIEQSVPMDANGKFTYKYPLDLDIGEYTLKVVSNNNEVIDVLTFRIVIGDSEENN